MRGWGGSDQFGHDFQDALEHVGHWRGIATPFDRLFSLVLVQGVASYGLELFPMFRSWTMFMSRLVWAAVPAEPSRRGIAGFENQNCWGGFGRATACALSFQAGKAVSTPAVNRWPMGRPVEFRIPSRRNH